MAIGAVLTSGYGVALIALGALSTGASIKIMIPFYLLSFLLAAMFLALSVLIGICSRSRFQALGISLFVWALFVLFYEFLMMEISLFISNQMIIPLLTVSIFLNPVEIVRVWSILSLNGAAVFGPSLYDLTVWANGWVGTLLFILSSFVWIAIPLLVSHLLIRKGIEND